MTHQIRHAGLQARTNFAGPDSQLQQTFAQLRNELTNDNFLTALGKYSVDDPAKIDRLALANLRENRHARNDLSALHAARSCLFGSRQLGDRKWFSDKPGIARRLKTQDQRRQFRIGLIANLAFYNKLNLGDLQTLVHSGDPSGLATLSNSAALTIPVLKQFAASASPYDILRVLAPDRAVALTDAIRRIADLSDYIQSLCGYLAANQALEPAHDVICRLLRSGADFGHAAAYNPIQVAAAAAAPLCNGPDVDGTLVKASSSSQPRRNNFGRLFGNGNRRGNSRQPCPDFQRGTCATQYCPLRHVCARCFRPGHGRDNCYAIVRRPMNNNNGNGNRTTI